MTAPARPQAEDGIHEIRVPRESVNADSVYVVGWLVPDRAQVEPGTPVCEVETSKAVFTVEADQAGFLRHRADVGDEVAIGGILGYITAQADAPLPVDAADAAPPTAGAVRFSAKAKALIAQLGLDETTFAGRGFVRERDVLEAAAARGSAAPEDPRGAFQLEPLGPVQRRVARVMEQSAATIPVAYMERVVEFQALRDRAQQAMQQANVFVTPVDLLVAAVARAAAQHPRFNASLTPEYRLRQYTAVHVGMAVDVEHDLYVVVVRDAAVKPIEVIARELRSLQYLAQRRRLTVDHLTGGTITVTSMLGRGVHRFQPIPYPEQTAIVGLCDPAPGTTQAMVTLGFDHRAANGSQAAQFLAAVAAALAGNGSV